MKNFRAIIMMGPKIFLKTLSHRYIKFLIASELFVKFEYDISVKVITSYCNSNYYFLKKEEIIF